VDEELLAYARAARFADRRPDYPSHATGLDRIELDALPITIPLAPPGSRTGDR
jgi:hypothetical protein